MSVQGQYCWVKGTGLILLHIEFQKFNTIVNLMSMPEMILILRTSVSKVSVFHRVDVKNHPLNIWCFHRIVYMFNVKQFFRA